MAGADLPAVDVSGRLDCHNVRVFSEDLVEHRAHVLPIAVLVEVQLDDLLQGQWVPCDWMLLELHDIWHNICDVICGPIRCAGLKTAVKDTHHSTLWQVVNKCK